MHDAHHGITVAGTPTGTTDRHRFYTVAQAARVLGVDPTAVRAALRRGTLGGERVGARVWLIPISEVERRRVQRAGKRKPGPRPRGAVQVATSLDAGDNADWLHRSAGTA